MAKDLIIVESPNKIKKIKKLLGNGFEVAASVGHIRDLPKGEFGYEIDGDCVKATYVNTPDNQNLATVKKLKSLAKQSNVIYLATDPDREGEAIAWHLENCLGRSRDYRRMTYTEITKSALERAITSTRKTDINLVNAYQARRIMDRAIGYIVSPIVRQKVGKGASAGRVQSVLVRLICELDTAIKNFKESLYWSLKVDVGCPDLGDDHFTIFLKRVDGKAIGYVDDPNIFWIKSSEELNALRSEFSDGKFIVRSLTKKANRRKPHPPYVTSELLGDCSSKFKWSSDKTMGAAQKLFELGKITYHRTDSTAISQEASEMAKQYILENFSSEYYPKKPHNFGKVSGAQEAHECIRPTSLSDEEIDELREESDDLLKCYELIKQKFIASQMSHQNYYSIKCLVDNGRGEFEASGKIIVFDGWTRYGVSIDDEDQIKDESSDSVFPNWLREQLELTPLSFHNLEKKTKPPARFTEKSLIKKMESTGIGRPSTYASSIKKVITSGYVEVKKNKFYTTDLGFSIVHFLLKVYPSSWMEFNFTRDMEEDLDRVTSGSESWEKLVILFDKMLRSEIDQKADLFKDVGPSRKVLEDQCPKCSKNLVEIPSKNGSFISCSGYPDCKYIKEDYLEENCPECESPLVLKKSKKKPSKSFKACSGYPNCDWSEFKNNKKRVQVEVSDKPCPKCGKELHKRKGKKGFFFGCSGYPDCKHLENI